MGIFIIIIIAIFTPLILFKSCGTDSSAPYRISYGTFINYTQVKNVHSYTMKDNCIAYTYGDAKVTETYCGEHIEILPNN